MASTTSTPDKCLTVAEWRPDGLSGRAQCFGVLSEEHSRPHLFAKFKFGTDLTGPCAAIHLEFLPFTASDESDYVFPDQTISVVVTADSIHSISQDTPSLALSSYGVSNSKLRQAVRLHLTLKRAPAVLMPRKERSLANAQEMAHLQALKSLSQMTSFMLLFVRSDSTVDCLRNFRQASRKINLDGSVVAVRDSQTHYSFSGPAGSPWSRYRVQQHTIAPLEQNKALHDNGDNSQKKKGSHGVKRTSHDDIPARGSGMSSRVQSEPPAQNSNLDRADNQSILTSATSTLGNTQDRPPAVPKTDSQVEGAPSIPRSSPNSSASSRDRHFRHQASSITDHATSRGTQVSTSASTEHTKTSDMRLQIDKGPEGKKRKQSSSQDLQHESEDAHVSKRPKEAGSFNSSSARILHPKAEDISHSHTGPRQVPQTINAADSSLAIPAGTQAQLTPASHQHQLSPDELIKRWRKYFDWVLLDTDFNFDNTLRSRGLLSDSLRAARAGDVTTFADKLADIFMLIDENEDEH